ncbi:unnamed protein product, partial [Durusdinium trenchii]
ILAVAHKLAQTMGERWERECDNFLWSLELEEFNSLGQECKNHPSLPDFVEEVEKVYKEKFEFMGKNGEPIEDLIQFVLYLVRQEEVEGAANPPDDFRLSFAGDIMRAFGDTKPLVKEVADLLDLNMPDDPAKVQQILEEQRLLRNRQVQEAKEAEEKKKRKPGRPPKRTMEHNNEGERPSKKKADDANEEPGEDEELLMAKALDEDDEALRNDRERDVSDQEKGGQRKRRTPGSKGRGRGKGKMQLKETSTPGKGESMDDEKNTKVKDLKTAKSKKEKKDQEQ